MNYITNTYQNQQFRGQTMSERYSQFKDEAEAQKEISDAGYYPLTIDFPALTNEEHWHDFDSMSYVLEGEVTLTDTQAGTVHVCKPGTKIIGTRGFLHHEKTEGYKALIGVSVNPEELTQPIDKAPSVTT
jgi:hypothetical protein